MQVFNQLPPAGQKLARIPRFGRLIGRMDDAQLNRLDSNAAVYWEVLTYISHRNSETTGLLDTGLKSEGAYLLGWHHDQKLDRENRPISIRKWQVRLALSFLSAVAFQMMCGTDDDGNPAPMDRVEPDDVELFEESVKASMISSGVYIDEDSDTLGKHMWSQDWDCIKNLNAGLDYNVFSDCGSRILFTDNNFRDFLAAHWAVRWASPDEQRLTQDWLPYCLDDKEDYTEFWNRVIELRELPTSAKQKLAPFAKETWKSLIAPIYDIGLQANPDLPIRSTELIYRTWERMEGHASKQAFQNEFAELTRTSEVARRLIDQEDGTSQFIRLADPDNPLEKETFRKVNHSGKLLAEFQMGSSDNDQGAGDDEKPRRCVVLSPFAMHRFCITNVQFELFDPVHHNKCEFADQVDSVDHHPVVNVCWYDAWCFANWIGGREIGGEPHQMQLPSEAHWEYACRSGEPTPFTWHDREHGDRIVSGDANFDDNYPWSIYDGADKCNAIYLRRTIAVNGIDAKLQIAPNPWGLYQMHGNVFEWCQDWFADYDPADVIDPEGAETSWSRVLRGGSWLRSGRFLRSADRDLFGPSLRLRNLGFRLAAVPLSQASQVEQAEA